MTHFLNCTLVFPAKVLSLAAFCCLAGGVAQAQKPNIVYILVDDFGYESLNSYGASTNRILTPSIDRIADEGVRFTDASTPSSVCTPTRYGVLMGEYPYRSDRQWGVAGINDRLLPSQDKETLADWLKGQGYNTSAIGKWHLGFQDQGRSVPSQSSSGGWLNAANDALDPGPRALGFDYFFGVPHNNDDRTGAYVENEGIYQLQSQNIDANPGSNHLGNDYFGFDVPAFDVTSYSQTLTDKAVDWLDQQTGASDPFFMYFNPVAVHAPIEPSPSTQGTSNAGAYGDFIHEMDKSVGEIMDKLEDMGVLDDTLVVFTSDNGGDFSDASNSSGLDINGDLRGDKHTIWEGGTRVPFMARLPGTIPQGTVSNDMVNLVDSFATIVDLVDPNDPAEGGAAADSLSFVDSLTNPTTPGGAEREVMITANSEGVLAIRRDGWKYVEGVIPSGNPDSGIQNDQTFAQLYNLNVDLDESNNVIGANASIASDLQAELDAYRAAATSLVIPGDVNDDGVLTAADITAFAAGWRTDTSQMATIDMVGAGDLNLDGTTDFEDWFLVRAAFNEAGVAIPAGITFGAVPEPGSGLALALLLSGAGLGRYRRPDSVREVAADC